MTSSDSNREVAGIKKPTRMPLRPIHRAKGFFTAIIPKKLAQDQHEWIREQLTQREFELFSKMSMVDQVHSYRVAQHVESALESSECRIDEAERPWMLRAALLHDVGKTVANLGTIGRVIATLSIAVGGSDMGQHWARTRGMTRRIGLYAMYPDLGADMLTLAESDPLIAAWAREHHFDEAAWTVPVDCGRILAAADDAA